ncbi:MAG: glycosyltransferase family 4 protein, partial [SAR324 cluster bacterium]|nr:glycosyltransferase family 4 protein [SAR324 cluster bacterium]
KLVKEYQATLIQGSGVDTQRFAPVPEPEGELVVALIARMLWEKGVGELVEAVKILKRRQVFCKIMLVGVPDVNHPSAIGENQLLSWVKEGIVDWLGFQSDVPAVLAKSHIVCLPSYREGMPLSLIEAAACARPIITTDVPGCREAVEHGVTGFLVPLKDSVAIADALQKLLVDKELRQKMGKNGRNLVMQRFAKEIVIQKTFAVYHSLLKNKWPYCLDANGKIQRI